MTAQNKIKIGVVGPRGYGNFQGGIETYCNYLYNFLSDEFYTTVYIRRGRNYIRENVIAVRTIPSIQLKELETLVHSLLVTIIARVDGQQILHVHGIGSCLWLPLAKLLGLKIVVRHVGADYRRAKWRGFARAILRLGEHFAALFADTVVCLNEQIAQDFSSTTGRQARVYVLANGVAEPHPSVQDDIFNRLRLARGGYVLSVGRLVSEKAHDLLIEAFVAAELPSTARLLIVGAADYPSAYSRQLSARAAGDPRIILAGTLYGDDLWSLYEHCRIFALPSSHEGMSFSLLEAAVRGCNIVASDISANATVCAGYARLVQPGSMRAMADALANAWHDDRSSADRLVQIACVRGRHSWPNIAARMDNIFHEAAPVERAGIVGEIRRPREERS